MTIDIIIVNWNSGNQLRACIDSINSAARGGFVPSQVIVVDNASSDGSERDLCSEVPVKVIANHQNVGFGAACNQGAEESRSDYLLFLNPDTQLDRDTLGSSAAALKALTDSRVGILGVQLVDEEGKVTASCMRYPTPKILLSNAFGLQYICSKRFPGMFKDVSEENESHVVDLVLGAFFLVRRSLFEELKGFDEHFFVYFEEVDFSKRAFDAGYATYYLASTRAFHRGHGTTDQIRSVRLYYSLNSKITYAFKHFRLSSALLVFASAAIVEPISRICWGLLRGSSREVYEVCRGYMLFFAGLRSLMASLRSVRAKLEDLGGTVEVC